MVTRAVWTNAETLAPTGIRSPDRPTRSESLYRPTELSGPIVLGYYMFHYDTRSVKNTSSKYTGG